MVRCNSMHRKLQQLKNPEAGMRKDGAIAGRSAIRAQGLKPGARHHVHLSPDIRTALAVGTRYGVPAILEVDAQRMHRQGHTFFVAENGVWLTDAVPAEYLTRIDKPAR
ncbi:2'-phosphotransferase [Burkholderia stabilis]|nr:2'-phosphotransferase [Burkholderia stabilis]